MAYTLADLPLGLDTSNSVKLVYAVSKGFIPWIGGGLTIVVIAVPILTHSKSSWFWPILPAFCTYLLIRAVSRSQSQAAVSSLLIDSTGVHVTVDKFTRDYLWHEIARTRQVLTNRYQKDATLVVQIQRKGELVHEDTMDLVPMVMDNGELESSIRAGIARWGHDDTGRSPTAMPPGPPAWAS